MASAARLRSLSRHSSDSLERISYVGSLSCPPLRRLAELAEQILWERQVAAPPVAVSPSVPVWESRWEPSEEEIPF
jgi:hypothetical protein